MSSRRHQLPPEHPENLAEDDSDYANLRPPTPRSLDELAAQGDPTKRTQLNRRSSRQAWAYLVYAVVIPLLFGAVLAVIMRQVAGAETCEAAGGRFLCRQDLWQLWAVLTSLPPIAFLGGCMAMLLRKLNRYLRWRPWMAVFWILLVYTMWMLTITVQIWLASEPPM